MLSNLPGNPAYCAIGCQFSLEVVTFSVTLVRSQPERISPSSATFLKWNLPAYQAYCKSRNFRENLFLRKASNDSFIMFMTLKIRN